jgi:hypothetical protein
VNPHANQPIGTVEGISGKVAIKDMNVQSEHDIIQWSKEIAVMRYFFPRVIIS